MGKRIVWSIISLLLLTSSCEIFEATPVDGTYHSFCGCSVEIQHGRCVRAHISSHGAFNSSDTTWSSTFSEGIQSSGYFPNYEYRYSNDETLWWMAVNFDSYTDFTYSLYIEHGGGIFCEEGHFELIRQ